MYFTRPLQLILSLILTGLLLSGCAPSDATTEPGAVGLANPASVYCAAQGGVLEIRTDADGGQAGVCVFPDGSECEEWAYFRGECAPGDTQLFDTLWLLQSYAGQTPLPGTTPTLTISPDWQIGGSSGCNSFSAGVTRDEEAWQVGEIASTLMACLEGMEQEAAIFALLPAITHHTLAAGSLTLHTPQGDLVYAPAPPTSLEGALWTLNGLAEGDAVVSTWLDAEINIQFAEGQVNGSGGCNTFFGPYTLDGETLTFGPLAQTRMACEEERMQREAAFMQALEQAAAYRTELDTLTLLDGDGRILLLFTRSAPTP
jgi:heat shock protein HslJ/putative hemolysin